VEVRDLHILQQTKSRKFRLRWNVVSVMFILIRYLTVAIRAFELVFYTDALGLLHPSSAGCKAWAMSGYIVYACVEILLMTRLFAFYGRSRRVLACLMVLFFLGHGASLTLAFLAIPDIVVVPSRMAEPLRAGKCVVVDLPHFFVNYWIPGLVSETLLFFLLLVKFFLTRRKASMATPHLLLVFVRDGAWGFAAMFAALLWCAIAFELSIPLGDIALTWLYSAFGICGSRLILNLRSAAKERTWATTQLRDLNATLASSSPAQGLVGIKPISPAMLPRGSL